MPPLVDRTPPELAALHTWLHRQHIRRPFALGRSHSEQIRAIDMDTIANEWMDWLNPEAYADTSPQNDVQGEVFA